MQLMYSTAPANWARLVMKNGSFMTIEYNWLNSLIMIKHPNTFKKQKLHEQKIMVIVRWSVIGVVH